MPLNLENGFSLKETDELFSDANDSNVVCMLTPH